MIKVHCTAQEYWYMRKQKCKCGGEFDTGLQMLKHEEGTHVDIHRVTCKKCGINRDFVFDISPFFGQFRSYKDLAKVEAMLKKVYPDFEVSMKMASPMEATLMYLNLLAESDDRIALQFIADAALYALEEKNTSV